MTIRRPTLVEQKLCLGYKTKKTIKQSFNQMIKPTIKTPINILDTAREIVV